MSAAPIDIVAVDGRITRLGDLRLADFWLGFAFGAGFFETILIRSGVAMFLGEHLDRLRASLALHRPKVRAPPDDVLETTAVADVIGRCLEQSPELGPHFTGAAKLIASDGRLLLTFRPYALDTIGKIDIAQADRSTYRRGDATLNHKSTSYFRQYRYIDETIVFVNERDELCETPTGNLFFLSRNSIVTPPLEAPCLPGVVRASLLKMKTLGGMPVIETDLALADLEHARACVMTNSLQLATQVDSLLGTPMTRSADLATLFRDRLIAVNHPGSHYCRKSCGDAAAF